MMFRRLLIRMARGIQIRMDRGLQIEIFIECFGRVLRIRMAARGLQTRMEGGRTQVDAPGPSDWLVIECSGAFRFGWSGAFRFGWSGAFRFGCPGAFRFFIIVCGISW